jgi:hypothetical protein
LGISIIGSRWLSSFMISSRQRSMSPYLFSIILNVSHISYRITEWSLPCPISLSVLMIIYTVNPGYPRDLTSSSSTASATTSFRGVTGVNPNSSSALIDSKLMFERRKFSAIVHPLDFGGPAVILSSVRLRHAVLITLKSEPLCYDFSSFGN